MKIEKNIFSSIGFAKGPKVFDKTASAYSLADGLLGFTYFASRRRGNLKTASAYSLADTYYLFIIFGLFHLFQVSYNFHIFVIYTKQKSIKHYIFSINGRKSAE